jgi:hypothetical protein
MQSTGQQTTIVQPPQAGRPGVPNMPPSQQPTTAMPGVRGSQQYAQSPQSQSPPSQPPQSQPPRPPVRPADVEQDTSLMPPRRPRQQSEDKTNYVRTLAPLVGMSVVVVVVIAAIMAWISSLQEPASPALTANRPTATAPPAPATSTTVAPTTTKPKASITRTVPKTTTTRAVPKTTVPAEPAVPGAGAGGPSAVAPTTAADPSANGDNGGETGSTPATTTCTRLFGCAAG